MLALGMWAACSSCRCGRVGPGRWWALLCLPPTPPIASSALRTSPGGARLGGDEALRQPHRGLARGRGLVGVVLASLLPTLLACPPCWRLRPRWCWAGGLDAARPALRRRVPKGRYHPAQHASRGGAWGRSRPSAACWRCSCSTVLPAPSRPLVLFFSKTVYRRHPRREPAVLAPTSSAPPSVDPRCGCAP